MTNYFRFKSKLKIHSNNLSNFSQKLQIASNKAAEERQRRIKFDEDVDEEKI
jgi:hypothetical protein